MNEEVFFHVHSIPYMEIRTMPAKKKKVVKKVAKKPAKKKATKKKK